MQKKSQVKVIDKNTLNYGFADAPFLLSVRAKKSLSRLSAISGVKNLNLSEYYSTRFWDTFTKSLSLCTGIEISWMVMY